MEKDTKQWSIEHRDFRLGPISSYALALWGLQGLLFPDDVVTNQNKRPALAGYIPGMQPFIRNNGHLHRAKLWAIAGGKGGVGKSVFTALLGIALAGLKKRVIIIDADFYGPNQREIFGLTRQVASWWSVLQSRQKLSSIALPTRIPNLRVIPGSTGFQNQDHSDILHRIKLVQALRRLDADIVLLDMGPRQATCDLDYFLTSDLQLVLSSPEPTSMENLARFLKAIVFRKVRTAISSLVKQDLAWLEDDSGTDLALENLLYQMRALGLPGEEIMRRVLNSFNLRVIFNMIESNDYLKDAHLMNRYLGHEFGMHFTVAGGIRYEPMMHEALLQKNISLMTTYGNRAFHDILEISQKLLVNRSQTTHGSQYKIVKKPSIPSDSLVCTFSCSFWHECNYKSPGEICPVKNLN